MRTEPVVQKPRGVSGWLLQKRPATLIPPTDSDAGILVGLRDVWRGMKSWPIWMRVARQDIGMRYKRSLIGPFWISLSLAAMIIGMALLYSQIFKTPFKDYLTYLAVSMLCWNFLSATINESCSVLTDEGLLRALPVPITGLAGRTMMRNGIIFAHNLLTVAVMLVIFQAPIGLSALHALTGIGVYALFAVLLGMILGPICLRFRDLAQLISNVVQILFFMTPIIWQIDQVGGRVAFVTMNPLHHLIEIVRAPILGQMVPNDTWTFITVMMLLLAWVALMTVSASRQRVFMWM